MQDQRGYLLPIKSNVLIPILMPCHFTVVSHSLAWPCWQHIIMKSFWGALTGSFILHIDVHYFKMEDLVLRTKKEEKTISSFTVHFFAVCFISMTASLSFLFLQSHFAFSVLLLGWAKFRYSVSGQICCQKFCKLQYQIGQLWLCYWSKPVMSKSAQLLTEILFLEQE